MKEKVDGLCPACLIPLDKHVRGEKPDDTQLYRVINTEKGNLKVTCTSELALQLNYSTASKRN